MTSEEFVREIEGVTRDTIHEHSSQGLDVNDTVTLHEVKRAFLAIHDHIHVYDGDLFYETERPTDEALALIYAFIVLP